MSCSPGAFNCAYRNATQTEWTVTCEQSESYWQWSADCGKGWKCVSDGSVAHCVPKLALFQAWETWKATQTPRSTLEVEARQDADACDRSGATACNEHNVVRTAPKDARSTLATETVGATASAKA